MSDRTPNGEILVAVDRLVRTAQGNVVPIRLSTTRHRLLSTAALEVEDGLVTEEPRQASITIGSFVVYGRIEPGRGLVWQSGAA